MPVFACRPRRGMGSGSSPSIVSGYPYYTESSQPRQFGRHAGRRACPGRRLPSFPSEGVDSAARRGEDIALIRSRSADEGDFWQDNTLCQPRMDVRLVKRASAEVIASARRHGMDGWATGAADKHDDPAAPMFAAVAEARDGSMRFVASRADRRVENPAQGRHNVLVDWTSLRCGQ